MKRYILMFLVLLCVVLIVSCQSDSSDSASSDKAILSFSFEVGETEYWVSFDAERNGAVAVPYDTDVTSLVPTITIIGSSISPSSDVTQDFTNPVIYTVTAEDDSTMDYTVSVVVAGEDEKAINSFAFEIGEIEYLVSFDAERHGTVTVPYGTNVTALVPTITIIGSSISPASGVTQDFTNPVIYEVSAVDGSTAEYEISVVVSEDVNAIVDGANRLFWTQNNDGTWEWNNPDTDKTNGPGSSNTRGVIAMGFLGAYEVTGNGVYLDFAKITGDALVSTTPGQTGTNRFYSQDIEFLAMLGAITEDSTYGTKASDVMNYFMTEDNRYCSSDGCTAEELADKYASIYPDSDDAGLVEWQLASWVRAADLTGNSDWADDMVSEIEEDVSTAYFDINSSSEYYIIGLAGVLDATGSDDAVSKLLELQQDGGWSSENSEGSVQDTAYAVMALIKQNDSSNDDAIKVGVEWLKDKQDETTGGWKNDEDVENNELTAEAVLAISDYILGKNM